MTYTSGTITDPNPGPTLHTALASTLTTAGFTLVDTVTIAARTHKVYKSAAASNAQNLDWYLDIGYPTTGAGAWCMQPFEFYDPATDLGYRGLYSGTNNATIDATTFSRYGATGSALETNWVGNVASFTNYSTAIVTTAFGYWFSATTDRVILLQSNDASYLNYVGFYQPDASYAAKAGAGLYPLIGARVFMTGANSDGSAASVRAALTRVAPVTSFAGSGGWGSTVGLDNPWIKPLGSASEPVGRYISAPTLPAGSTVSYPFTAWPVGISSSATGGPSWQAFLGYLRDVAVIAASGVARGDTVTIAGATWVLATSGATGHYQGPGAALLFKAV